MYSGRVHSRNIMGGGSWFRDSTILIAAALAPTSRICEHGQYTPRVSRLIATHQTADNTPNHGETHLGELTADRP